MRSTRFVVVIAAFGALAGCGRKEQARVNRDPGPIQVAVSPVAVRQIHRVVESVGTMFPFDEVIVSAEVEGKIEAVDVDLGDAVRPNQVLARISPEEQGYVVAQNEAQLRQSLERLGLKNENDKVIDIRETPEVRRAEADLIDAEQRFNRLRELVKKRIMSQQDLDQAEARLKSMRATYDSTLNQTQNLIREIERVKASLDLQRKKLRDTSVRAPFAASVKERTVTMGQYVQVNTPLFTLVKTDPIRLRLEIPERMAPWIRQGQNTDVTVEAFGSRVFNGKVWRISPTVDQSKRTFIVEALIQNPANELKPGSYAKARVNTDKLDEIALVPFRAVNYVLGSYKAYVVNAGTVEAREVKLGERFGDDVEVVQGLGAGERVATTEVARLDTGSKVRVLSGATAAIPNATGVE